MWRACVRVPVPQVRKEDVARYEVYVISSRVPLPGVLHVPDQARELQPPARSAHGAGAEDATIHLRSVQVRGQRASALAVRVCRACVHVYTAASIAITGCAAPVGLDCRFGSIICILRCLLLMAPKRVGE